MKDTSNVTPFKRLKETKPLFDPRDPKAQVSLVYALAIGSFAIMLFGNQFVDWIGMGLGVAAVVVSAAKRDEGVFWARSHFEFALRTVIIGAVGWLLVSLFGLILGLIPFLGPAVLFLAKAVIAVWVAVRCGFGYLKSSDTKVIENPVTWLI